MKTLILFFVLFTFTILYSTIINVPVDQPTIQSGIDAAVNTDTVLVQSGTYFENINYNGKLITVGSLYLTTQDTTYISQTVIDGDSLNTVVKFESGEDSTAVLIGLSITNGIGYDGGGIYCENSSPSLVYVIISNSSTAGLNYYGGGIYCINSNPLLLNVTIADNVAHLGGGIYCWLSSPILHNVTITGNSSPFGVGGGIYLWNSNPILSNVFIINNNAYTAGGGIYCEDSSPSLVNVIISDNSAEYNNGGGISCNSGSNPILQNVTISGNYTFGNGGGISCNSGSSPILQNVTITSNGAYENGGGICCCDNSNPNLSNITVTDNFAQLYGGGIQCYLSNPILENVSISYNHSVGAGGGISSNQSSLSLENVTISDNLAQEYGGGFHVYLSNPTVRNVIITGNSSTCGGGINFAESDPSLVNLVITENSAFNIGGGINCWDSNPCLMNVTIAGNSANDEGGGICCNGNSNISLIDCILWNNSPHEISFAAWGDPNSITINYSDIYDGETGIVTNNNGTVNWLEGNIDEDPLFVGAGDHPFMLQGLSPCVNAGIPDTTGLNLPEFDLAGNSRIYGGRIDMGAYEWQGVYADEPIIPNSSILIRNLHNYPNPFNPTTTISFSVNQTLKSVELEIYNIKGQKVKKLISDQLPVGQHSVIWNGTDDKNRSVSSGIYFYKMKADNFEKTKKMILMK